MQREASIKKLTFQHDKKCLNTTMETMPLAIGVFLFINRRSHSSDKDLYENHTNVLGELFWKI